MTLPDGKLRLCDSRLEPANLVEMSSFRFTSIGKNLAALLAEVFPESCHFAVTVNGLNGLFERDCDEQTDDNSRNVNEEAFPGMQNFVGSVDIKHGR
jgi:hypothetical protein